MDTENIKIQIKTFFGLEPILAEEIKKLGGKNVEIKNRAVNCEGDLGFLYKINYSARTALKILVPIHEFKAFNQHQFYDRLFKFEWENFMDVTPIKTAAVYPIISISLSNNSDAKMGMWKESYSYFCYIRGFFNTNGH